MVVTIVADVLGEENNGTTIACMNLIRYLKARGDTVKVLCCDKTKIGQEGYYVVPTLFLGFIISHILKKNNVSLAKGKTKIIKKALQGSDICHLHLPFMLSRKTLKMCKKMNIPTTAGFHCQAENFTSHIFHFMNCGFVNHLIYKNYYNHFYKNIASIHYPTKFIKDLFENDVKKKTNGYVISNGVNSCYQKKHVDRKEEFSHYFNILFIGRFSKEKTHHILIKAVSLSKYKDNIQLVFAGQGPRKKQILNLSKKLKIRMPIMQFLKREELVNVINSCDLYVHPSEIEIEAISCLEAITCGLVPIISDSKRSATKAFALDERNLFDHTNPQDLANKIDYWYENKIEKKACSDRYLGYTRKFEQNFCMEKMREMLVETIEKYGK